MVAKTKTPGIAILLQFREGGTRLVASNTREPLYCPVRLTGLYFNRLGGSYSCSRYDGFLVPRTRRGLDIRLEADGRFPLGYTTAKEDLRNLLAKLGYDSARFTEHSGKRGGATTAAERGMASDDLQRLGGWRSRGMAAKYTDASAEKRLKLSSLLH